MQHGVQAGTPEYMSPEQANLDARDVDASSDVSRDDLSPHPDGILARLLHEAEILIEG